MTPIVEIEKTDGNLGVSADTDRILAIIGPASAGATEVAQAYTNKNDVLDEHKSGLLVEAGCYMLARGIPVVLIRTTPTTPGDYGAINATGVTGTATVAEGATAPDGDYDVTVEVLTGGALGTAGIVYRYTMDGINWSEPQALGTSLTLTCARGVSFTLAAAAATLVKGDRWTVTTTGPKDLTGDLSAAFTALADYSGEWLRVLVLAEADDTILAQCDAFAESFHAEGKYPEVITALRQRGAAETRAAYQTAMAAILSQVQSSEVSPCPGHCEMVSEVNGWRLRVPQSIPFAAVSMLIDDSQDAAAFGALTGIFLQTAKGERKYHDERRFPGLDALGLTCLRTWGGRPVKPGVYINNPRVISGPGSDYRYFQHSAIVNRIIESAFSLLEPRLSRSVLCDPETGKIRPDVAKSIEDAITAELRTIYADPGRVSAVKFTLSRTDNILSTDTLTFGIAAIPLAFIKKFLGKAGLARVLPN